MHFFITEVCMSSYPGAEFLSDFITEITASYEISGITILLGILSTYNNGFTLQCILFARMLPIEIK